MFNVVKKTSNPLTSTHLLLTYYFVVAQVAIIMEDLSTEIEVLGFIVNSCDILHFGPKLLHGHGLRNIIDLIVFTFKLQKDFHFEFWKLRNLPARTNRTRSQTSSLKISVKSTLFLKWTPWKQYFFQKRQFWVLPFKFIREI